MAAALGAKEAGLDGLVVREGWKEEYEDGVRRMARETGVVKEGRFLEWDAGQ